MQSNITEPHLPYSAEILVIWNFWNLFHFQHSKSSISYSSRWQSLNFLWKKPVSTFQKRRILGWNNMGPRLRQDYYVGRPLPSLLLSFKGMSRYFFIQVFFVNQFDTSIFVADFRGDIHTFKFLQVWIIPPTAGDSKLTTVTNWSICQCHEHFRQLLYTIYVYDPSFGNVPMNIVITLMF
jgi:hypothetical protein